QQPVDGASLAASFDDASAPGRRTQYFEMMGSRSIVHGRWKATTDHVVQGVVDEEELMAGSREFSSDHWALVDLDRDFSEAVDVGGDHPEVVRQLQELWLIEAGRNNVMPLSEGLARRLAAIVPADYPAGLRAVFRPGGSPVADEAMPLLAFGFTMAVDTDVPPGGASGVLFALGDWNGGYALYAVDGVLHFTLNAAGHPVTAKASSGTLPAGRHRLSVEYSPGEGPGGSYTLACDGDTIGSAVASTALPLALQHGGAHLRIGSDRGFPVCDDYVPPFPWEGTIHEMTVETPGFGGAPADQVRTALHAD
ncbi:MAG: hypothetical protein J2P57_21355, partial [Acidimicrobiaceae bacterium]|nr:hypothetical protein [Acidimicrobiaceae bacterium]